MWFAVVVLVCGSGSGCGYGYGSGVGVLVATVTGIRLVIVGGVVCLASMVVFVVIAVLCDHLRSRL